MWIERLNWRLLTVISALGTAGSFALSAHITDLKGQYIAWALIGLAMPMVLTQTAFAAVAQLMPHASRRALGWLTLLSGLCPPIFLPLIAAIEPALGWRGTCFPSRCVS